LIPYGGGSLSSLTINSRLGLANSTTSSSSTTQLTPFLGGIPKNIYQSLHNRLKRCVKIPVISSPSSSSSAASISSSIPNLSDELTLEYFHHSQQLNEDTSQSVKLFSLIHSRVRLGNGNHRSIRQFSTSLAWCFQTWWGHEVCVTIQVSKLSQSMGGRGNGPSVSEGDMNGNANGREMLSNLYWSGWMEIQCDDLSTLTALKSDSSSLINYLTQNLLKIATPSSLSSSTLSANDRRTDLSQSNGLFPLLGPSIYSTSVQTGNLVNLSELQKKEQEARDKKVSLKTTIRNFIFKKFQNENKAIEVVNNSEIVSFL
jgi:hypothetical protein